MSAPSRSADARVFAARARRRRLRRAMAVIALAGAVAAMSFAGWLIGWSGVLALDEVSVEGAEEALADEVRTIAAAPLGTPLVRVDTSAVAERVRGLPEVADVEVGRSWPNTLTIAVTPRIGAAAIRRGDRWWQVDESGVMFGEAAAQPESLPLLDAPADENSGAVRAAGVAVLTGLPAEVEALVEGVQAESEADIRLLLADDVVVKWGTADRIGDKAEVLLALMAAQDEAPAVYDVSAPEHPAVTP